MIDRRVFINALAFALLAAPHAGRAQAAGKFVRIGFLSNSRQAALANGLQKVFIAALRDLGWSEGRNLVIEYRWAEQRYERFPALASELVALGVDLIVVTARVTAALAAKQATATIPILAVGIADPVKFGLVASFARPGANVTDLMQPLANWGKWLELAREAVVGVTRIAVIGNPANIVYPDYVAQNEAAARQLGLSLQMIPVARAEELAPTFEAMKRGRAEVLVFGPEAVFLNNVSEILERASVNRLPVIAPFRPAAVAGALASYGADNRHLFSQAASYADRILRGAKPADLPIQQPSRFELVINLKTAKALGLTIPQSLLLRADEVIQ